VRVSNDEVNVWTREYVQTDVLKFWGWEEWSVTVVGCVGHRPNIKYPEWVLTERRRGGEIVVAERFHLQE
jgi:hypothetical protein